MSSKSKIFFLIWIPVVAALALMLSIVAKSDPIGEETKNAGQQDMKNCNELTDARGWSVGVWKPGGGVLYGSRFTSVMANVSIPAPGGSPFIINRNF
jgi:hypothetical protein